MKKSTFWGHQVGTFESWSNKSGLRFSIFRLFDRVIANFNLKIPDTLSKRQKIEKRRPLLLLQLLKVPTWWSQNVNFLTFSVRKLISLWEKFDRKNFYNKKVGKSPFWGHLVGTFEGSSNKSGLGFSIWGLFEGVTDKTRPKMADTKNPRPPLRSAASKTPKYGFSAL